MIKERKLFFAWQLEKEKAYLEQKSRDGFTLKKIGFGTYYFEKSDARDVVFQFDFRPLHRKDEKEYLSLYEEWEYVGRFSSWYYFRKERVEGEEHQIFSNVESKREMLRRLLGFLLLTGFPLYYQVIIFFPNMEVSSIRGFYQFFKPFVYVVLALHSYALLKLALLYNKLKKDITE